MKDTAAQAWTNLEIEIRHDYAVRLTALLEHPKAHALLVESGLEHCFELDPSGVRLNDLSVAIYKLENALAEDRAPLPLLSLIELHDRTRYPGFDGIEADAVAEEQYLLRLRDGLRDA